MNDEPRKLREPHDPQIATIATNYVRNPKTGKITSVRIVPFEPGMVLMRAGHKYRVDAKGTQRRID